MMRPLFLEFSNPVPDGHPLDLDAGNEFMLGRSILVAPPPYPEKPDEYKVLLPSGHWSQLLDWRPCSSTDQRDPIVGGSSGIFS